MIQQKNIPGTCPANGSS